MYMDHGRNSSMGSMVYCALRDWSNTQSRHIDHMHTPYLAVANHSLVYDLWLFPANPSLEFGLLTECYTHSPVTITIVIRYTPIAIGVVSLPLKG